MVCLKPIPGGTYAVNDSHFRRFKGMVFQGQHASNLGGIISK